MGLHLPGAAFINPGTELRHELTTAAAQRALRISARGSEYTPVGQLVDEKALTNAIIGLLATGGSTNHTLHLVAIARAAGLVVDWDDFNSLSRVVPLLTHVYPSGEADVNQFHAAGGMALIIRELLDAGLLHDDVMTIAGDQGLRQYVHEPWLDNGKLAWRDTPGNSLDKTIITGVDDPFLPDGGLRLLTGNLGRAVVKTSAVKPQHRIVEAPAIVFHSQDALKIAFDAGELEQDFIAVIMYQGPRANGMPELHKLTPLLGVLLDRGFNVALVTDGRMSGASGKVPAAIHVSPECVLGGPLAHVRTGDMLRLDTQSGLLQALVEEIEWASRTSDVADLSANVEDMGRELFAGFRQHVSTAETGAVSVFGD
jgi:phosphogluconate dehydratase